MASFKDRSASRALGLNISLNVFVMEGSHVMLIRVFRRYFVVILSFLSLFGRYFVGKFGNMYFPEKKTSAACTGKKKRNL